MGAYVQNEPPASWQVGALGFLHPGETREQRILRIQGALESPARELLVNAIGQWSVEQLIPVEALVPDAYERWRAPIRDCMLFVISHLSAARLAPKILEQMELPPETPPEVRLIKLIAKVPGLQKLGQVLSRNRHLKQSLREALSQLENGIRDVSAEDMCGTIRQQLGKKLDRYKVELRPELLSEASVSAVLRFTWTDPETQLREHGVFKVMKPHVPGFFAEDMRILQALANHIGSKRHEYGAVARVIPDTFRKVRRLLQREVNFRREQKTLAEADELYKSKQGVRVPVLIRQLCTPTITAITEEHGVKVTSALAGMTDFRRGRVAEQLIDALVATPLFAPGEDVIFHADPHAGNLLYNNRTGELIIVDWALTERLSLAQRRRLALMFFMVTFRNAAGITNEIQMLSQHADRDDPHEKAVIRETVDAFLEALPMVHVPNLVDAMRLLEAVALNGIRFPAPLIMFSKVLFTLDGILHDVGGSAVWMGATMGRHLGQRWLASRQDFGYPLSARDWLSVQISAMLYGGRLLVQMQEAMVDWLLPLGTKAS